MCKFIILNNGVKMPILGLGTSRSDDDTKEAVKHAIDVGYRHVDCAARYFNEEKVGEAVREKIADGSVRREDMFIVNKLWSSFQHPQHVKEGLQVSLTKMGLDYVDLYLIHWPFGLRYTGPKIVDSFKYIKGETELEYDDVDFTDTWKAMEELYRSGLVKAVGISNFNIKQLERLVEHATVVPAVLQIECHPYLNQDELIIFCKTKGIAVVAYSPFASPSRPWVLNAGINMFEDEVLQSLARKYEKSIAQVVLRCLIQLGVGVIPKSVNPERISSNFDVFGFSLESSDMEAIRHLHRNLRIMPPKYCMITRHKDFPFPFEELV